MEGLKLTSIHYGDHNRQRVAIWEPSIATSSSANGYWLIFIHGGAWRDPRNSPGDFLPSIEKIASSHSDLAKADIRGFASIDYRLSPHPEFPQGPDTDPTHLQVAKHPDHIDDVESALQFLVDRYQLTNNYILIGHSAGATLAYQLAMIGSDRSPSFPLPRAIIGISGIYDLFGIDERHDGGYASFIASAFGDDRDMWRTASPVSYTGNYNDGWKGSKALHILAWSTQDSLIDEPEIDQMAAKLRNENVELVVMKDLTGDHDQVWQEGSQISRLVDLALGRLEKQ